jgi:transcriptional antiterminator RfaH
MPILAAEAQLYPADLFEATRLARSADRAWWVLHTRPRQEKSLARQLAASQVPFYLPLIPHRLQVRNRVMTSHLPLFTSYVFLYADRDERVAALATARVVQSLSVGDQARLWHDLTQVHRLLATGQPIQAEDRLVPGASVEIKSGPLAGLRGRIVREVSRCRFIVAVDFIQRGASVTLDDFQLTAVAE